MLAKKKLEAENEKRQANNRMHEIEVGQKEGQLQNSKELARQDKLAFDKDVREVYIREIQSKQIDVEARKKIIVDSENEFRKQHRLLEKKKELIACDTEQLQQRILQF